MKTIEIRKFKQKDAIIKKIGIDYKKIKYLEGNSLMICEDEESYISSNKDYNYYMDLKNKIDYILLQLEENLSKVIFNEYFSK